MPTPTKITHELVLQRAIEIVNEEGAEELSMRELARSLGVKAPSLYRYFPDKARIELAVVDQGNRKLLECLKGAAGLATPGDEWIAVGEVYLAFARAKPNLYRLMMEKRMGFPPSSTPGGSGRELWGFLLWVARVADGLAGVGAEMGSAQIGVGGGAEAGVGDTWRAVAFWSFLHGFASLEGAGRFSASELEGNGPGASGLDASRLDGNGPVDAFAVGLKALRNGFQAGIRT